jgi:hypothetical protein
LANRLGVGVQEWDVDGLGEARGFGLRSHSGIVYVLEELELMVLYKGARGPSVCADAADLVRLGTDALIDELLAAIELPASHIVGPFNGVVDSAAQVMRRRAAKGSAVNCGHDEP